MPLEFSGVVLLEWGQEDTDAVTEQTASSQPDGFETVRAKEERAHLLPETKASSGVYSVT
jgi:hypothetical protein